MTNTNEILNEQREHMQNDLVTILDGLDDKTLDSVCQVIVDRIEIIKRGLK